MANIQTAEPFLQPMATTRTLAGGEEARGRRAGLRGLDQHGVDATAYAAATQAEAAQVSRQLQGYHCPQHNISLTYDRVEDGWERYVCPVYRCPSKLMILLLSDQP